MSKVILSLSSNAEEHEVEMFLDAFQEIIDKTKLKEFFVVGHNLNWMGASGYLFCETNRALKVIHKVKPGTDDISIDILSSNVPGMKFMMKIYHHDCPTGSVMEFYSTTFGKRYVKEVQACQQR